MTERSNLKAEMQERILATTDRLFYEQGIRAVGVDTVAAEAGISKRTLYNYYPSKDELITAYLSRRFKPVPLTDAPPAQQILGNFDRLERSFSNSRFRGCPFVNAVAELKEPDHAANKIAIAFKDERRAWFRELLRRLGVADPDSLAMQLMLLVDGAIAAAVVRGDPKVARAAREAAATLLSAAGVDIAAGRPAPAGRTRRDAGHKPRRRSGN
jgi:AcrR family transcriptional regulator